MPSPLSVAILKHFLPLMHQLASNGGEWKTAEKYEKHVRLFSAKIYHALAGPFADLFRKPLKSTGFGLRELSLRCEAFDLKSLTIFGGRRQKRQGRDIYATKARQFL